MGVLLPRLVVGLVLLGSLAVGASGAPPAAGDVTRQAPSGSVTWLTTGDSYASGEGIAGTGVGSDLCAQSRQAFGPAAADLLRSQRRWQITPEAFTACTGHVTADLFNRRHANQGSLWDWAVEQGAPDDGRFDVVTFSFGGNDIGFAEVLAQDCLSLNASWSDLWNGTRPLACGVGEDELRSRVQALVAGDPSGPDGRPFHEHGGPFGAGRTHESLTAFYRRIAHEHLTERGVLVVVGYPRLFAPSEEWGRWRGGRCHLFAAGDADMLGRVADIFDDLLAGAVLDADPTGTRVVFLSRRDLWRSTTPSHELCGGNTGWTNGISIGLGDGSFRKEHSFHPNEQGHAATAEALAGRLDELLGVTPPPTVSPEPSPAPAPEVVAPPVTSGSRFGAGDPFEASCVVAWPTAPMRSTTSTSMRMSCIGVPSQFLFVDVTYGDPDLPVTPSTGHFDVRGQVVDVSQSEYGFGVLVVHATEVGL